MIRFLQHEAIDKSRWDDCIDHAVNGNLNACSWFLDIVSPGWCALVEDEYERVFPLTVSSRAAIKYLMQPYFTQQLGLFYRSVTSAEKLSEFLNSIPKQFKYIDINLNSSNSLPERGDISEMINLELDLNNRYETLCTAYQSNLQRNLKKAAQNKLSISKSVQPGDIISLFRANKGLELKHLQNNQYELIEHIAAESLRKGTSEIWGAYDDCKQLLAGILWVSSHQRSIFLFSALSEKGKKLHAMPWLIDEFIRQNAGRAITLDFEGSNNEGLARFYGSFGAQRVIYHRFSRNSLPLPFRLGLHLWRLSRVRIKKYLPFS